LLFTKCEKEQHVEKKYEGEERKEGALYLITKGYLYK